MRILIVEDEIRLAEALAQILSQNNYITDMVHNGTDGLDYAKSAFTMPSYWISCCPA
jgi:DNA-binding response OmpR family regulator